MNAYARYAEATWAAEMKIATAREAIRAAAMDVREYGHAHATPSLANAWTLFGNAHRANVYAAELAEDIGVQHPAVMEQECSELWDALRAAEGGVQ